MRREPSRGEHGIDPRPAPPSKQDFGSRRGKSPPRSIRSRAGRSASAEWGSHFPEGVRLARETLITKYVDAFPFSQLFLSRDGHRLYYLRQVEGRGLLHVLETMTDARLEEGRRLSNVDFSAGSFWMVAEDPERGHLYMVRDEDNRENYNLWRFDLRTGALRSVTKGNNVMGATFSADFRRAWGKDRRRLPDGTFRSEIFELDLDSLERRKLLDDEGWDYRIGWGEIHKVEDGEQLLFTLDYFNRRMRNNICLFDLKTGTRRLLLPEWMEESGKPNLCEDRPRGTRCWFLSHHEGFENLYELDWSDGRWSRRTDFRSRSEFLSVQRRPEGKVLFAALPIDEGFEVRRVREDGSYQAFVTDAVGMPFATDDDLWMACSTLDRARSLNRFEEGTFARAQSLALTAGPPSAIEHSVSRPVSYPTFDGARVSAWLQRPKGELKAALVVAFYGGHNVYNRYQQLFAELGIAVLSPAVRGTWGWDRAWEKKLEGDLGGDEIIDVAWGARWLQTELGLPPEKIGVWGSSHGGYATLRALTMPGDFRGAEAKARFEFGFAVAEAGFADLEAFHRDSRIADWLVHLLGPYDPTKYRERSPVHFVENLRCPVLIVNGTNDTRVPFSTMRGFVDRLRALDKPHRLLLHEGQGHHAATRESLLEDYRVLVEFLDDFVLKPKG